MAFDADAHWRLVATNWMRTGLWTARGGIATRSDIEMILLGINAFLGPNPCRLI
jgi:hypothetical protein